MKTKFILATILVITILNVNGQGGSGKKYSDVPLDLGYYEPFKKNIGTVYWYFGFGYVFPRGGYGSGSEYPPFKGNIGVTMPITSLSKVEIDEHKGVLGFRNKFYLHGKGGIGFIGGDFGLKKGVYEKNKETFGSTGLELGVGLVKNFNNVVNLEMNFGLVNPWNESGDYWKAANSIRTFDISARLRKFKFGLEWLNLTYKYKNGFSGPEYKTKWIGFSVNATWVIRLF